MAVLSSIHQYPVKSLGGNQVSQAHIGFAGMDNDRRWLITDPNGKFITARRYPKMLLWQASLNTQDEQDNLSLVAPNGERQSVTVQSCTQQTKVSVWKDTFTALTAPDAVNEWLSSQLNTPCLLHYLGKTSQRLLSGFNQPLSFADSAPYLLTTTATLAALNRHLPSPVSMGQFRPNFVIDDLSSDTCSDLSNGLADADELSAWDEEQWRRIRIGEVEFEFLKYCTRCVMINMNPKTGERSEIHEPFKTLNSLRKQRPELEQGVIFGIHLLAKNKGVIVQGSKVEVLATAT